jgi:uncharacterized protein VirK/YbjX
MKQSILTAMSVILTAMSAAVPRPALRPVVGGRLRNGLERLSKSAWLVVNPRTSLEVARLFASPQLRPVLRTEPRLMFKFLRDYLATDLSRKERAAMLMHHYAFLKERVDPAFFPWIVEDRRELSQVDAGGHVHRIWLWFPRTPYSEGDLALSFEVEGLDLYTLSFTIGPGTIAGIAADHAMYIARVQGKGRRLDRIRQATKDCQDVSPAAILLAAAEGVAQALDLDLMVGIGARIQVAPRRSQSDNRVKAYDEFWEAAGGLPVARQMYRLAVPSQEKSILEVKREHRSRTLRKRRFKQAIKEQVREAFRLAVLPARTVGALWLSLGATSWAIPG